MDIRKFQDYQRVRVTQDRRIEGTVLPSSDHEAGIIHVRFVWIDRTSTVPGDHVAHFYDGELEPSA